MLTLSLKLKPLLVLGLSERERSMRFARSVLSESREGFLSGLIHVRAGMWGVARAILRPDGIWSASAVLRMAH